MTLSGMANPVHHSEMLVCTFEEAESTPFHVAFGIDQTYIRGMGITLYSLLKNHPDQVFHIHLFTTHLTVQDRERIKRLASQYTLIISLHIFDEKWLKDLPAIGRYPKSIYFRLIIPAVVSHYTDRVLYIDADTLITGDMSPLFTLDFAGHTLAACNDTQRARLVQGAALGIRSGNYFNSGLLLINLPQWNLRHITEKMFDLLIAQGASYRFPDQDGLNILLENDVLILPERYNFIYDIIANKVWHHFDVPDDTAMIHFTGKCKPWHTWGGGDLSDRYALYYQDSPWSDHAFDPPKNHKEMKRFARVKLHHREYLPAAISFFKYIKMKIFR